MKTMLTVGVLLGVLVVAAVLVYRWMAASAPVELGTHGMVAMALGVLGTLVLGVGLMFLVFYSHRRGYDQAADEWRRDRRDRE